MAANLSPIHKLNFSALFSLEECSEAITELSREPANPLYTSALLEVLDERENQSILPETLDDLKYKSIASLENRFQALLSGRNTEALNQFMGLVLDFCFQRSSAHSLPFRDRLFNKVAGYLLNDLSRFENLRTYILAQSRHINKLSGQKDLIHSTIIFQNRLFKKTIGAATAPMQELIETRKFHIYMTPGVSKDSVKGYLKHDYEIPLKNVNRHLIAVYRTLLNVHRDDVEIIALAFTNLSHWLEQLPQTSRQWVELLPEIQKISRRSDIDWDDETQCHYAIRLHLQFHAELLRSAEGELDILQLMEKTLLHKEAEKALAAGFEALQYLPQLRHEPKRLIALLNHESMPARSLFVWEAAFKVCSRLISGLSVDEPTQQEPVVLGSEAARIKKARSMMLKTDETIRDLLQRIAFDKERYRPEVRQMAWSALLMSNPPNRVNLYEKVFSPVDRELLPTTLKA
ncbi:MAG TPA: hypothetical protein VJL89_10595, partial [Thermodesulfovibrionia bacterium]|nr:hypothetical protein [Thermodesulfovibrionia bacterium]